MTTYDSASEPSHPVADAKVITLDDRRDPFEASDVRLRRSAETFRAAVEPFRTDD